MNCISPVVTMSVKKFNEHRNDRSLDRFIPLRSSQVHNPLRGGLLAVGDPEDDATGLSILDQDLNRHRKRAQRRFMEDFLLGPSYSFHDRLLQQYLPVPKQPPPQEGRHWALRGPRNQPLLETPFRRLDVPDVPQMSLQPLDWGACGILAVICANDVWLIRDATALEPTKERLTLYNETEFPIALCWSPRKDEALLLVSISSGFVEMYDCRVPGVGPISPIARRPAWSVQSISWHPYKDLIALGLSTRVDFVTARLELVNAFMPGTHEGLSGVAFSPDGTQLAVSKFDGTVEVINRLGWTSLECQAGSIVTSLSWHPWQRSVLAASTLSGRILLMDVSSSKVTSGMYSPSSVGTAGGDRCPRATAITFAPRTGELVASFCVKGAQRKRHKLIVLTDLETVVDRVDALSKSIFYFGWSPDGLTLASVGFDEVLCLRDFMGKARTAEVRSRALAEAREARTRVTRRFGSVIR